MDLTGKTAIVTGASSGIGASTVRKLREAGVRVAGGARRSERVDADVSLALDVTDEAERCVRRGGRRRARGDRHPLQQRGARARPRAVQESRRGGGGASSTRTSTGCYASRGCACRISATVATSCSWARSPAGRPTRTAPRTSPRSSPCAGSPTRFARICWVGRSASRPSTPGSSKRSSRSCGSLATTRRPTPSTTGSIR